VEPWGGRCQAHRQAASERGVRNRYRRVVGCPRPEVCHKVSGPGKTPVQTPSESDQLADIFDPATRTAPLAGVGRPRTVEESKERT
jgi:hypothetical protein